MLTVVSPHLDDAVFSCGALLAARPGSTVITVLAGRPDRRDSLPPWDLACGFSPGDDVIAARRAEDRAALTLLRASPSWMPFRDAQYGPSPATATLESALRLALDTTSPTDVLLPMGLFHADHRLVARAALPLVRAHPERRFYAYEDALYRRLPGLVESALARIEAAGLRASPVPLTQTPSLALHKRRAVHCYASQLRGLTSEGRPGTGDLLAPEALWRLTP